MRGAPTGPYSRFFQGSKQKKQEFSLFYRPCFFVGSFLAKPLRGAPTGPGSRYFQGSKQKNKMLFPFFFQKTASFSVSGARRRNPGVTFLRKAFAQLCVQFRGCAWCVRGVNYDPARFLCRALAAMVPGVLAGALLQRLALEGRGWGCGVGTAVRNHTPV